MRNCFIIPLLILIFGCSQKRGEYITLDGFAQGTTYHIVYRADGPQSQALAKEIEEQVPIWFEQINKSVSGYDSTSTISKINRNAPAVADSIFIDLFNFAKEFYIISNGALDAASAPLFNIWGFGFSQKESVTQAVIDSIKLFTGMDMFYMVTDSTGNRIEKRDSRAQLNFNATAQGYSCDYFAKKLEQMGITDYMIEIGGEIFCKGVNPKGKAWRVGIDKPIDGNVISGESLHSILEVSGKGVVTSGNYRKYYIQDGKKYSHTIDPATGYPVEHNLLSATVIAKNATLADAYATYFMVIGLEKSKEILESSQELEAMLIYGNASQMEVYMTGGFKSATIEIK